MAGVRPRIALFFFFFSLCFLRFFLSSQSLFFFFPLYLGSLDTATYLSLASPYDYSKDLIHFCLP